MHKHADINPAGSREQIYQARTPLAVSENGIGRCTVCQTADRGRRKGQRNSSSASAIIAAAASPSASQQPKTVGLRDVCQAPPRWLSPLLCQTAAVAEQRRRREVLPNDRGCNNNGRQRACGLPGGSRRAAGRAHAIHPSPSKQAERLIRGRGHEQHAARDGV